MKPAIGPRQRPPFTGHACLPPAAPRPRAASGAGPAIFLVPGPIPPLLPSCQPARTHAPLDLGHALRPVAFKEPRLPWHGAVRPGLVRLSQPPDLQAKSWVLGGSRAAVVLAASRPRTELTAGCTLLWPAGHCRPAHNSPATAAAWTRLLPLPPAAQGAALLPGLLPPVRCAGSAEGAPRRQGCGRGRPPRP